LQDANTKLCQIRTTHPDAGGLIVAIDKRHAEFLADMLTDISHSRPLVVVSDDVDAHRKIDDFRKSPDPWVIAVKMIAEGVDIPRLRVCAYMTNIVTDMFFRQVVGRVIRYIEGINHQEAFVFIPSDHRLVEMARNMRNERIHAIIEESDKEEEDGLAGDGGHERSDGAFVPLDGRGWRDSTISFDGQVYSTAEIEEASVLARRYGIHPEVMARMVRDGVVGGLNGHGRNNHAEDEGEEPLYLRKRKLRASPVAKRLRSEIRNRFLSHIPDDEEAYRFLNKRLNLEAGAKSGNKKTEQERLRIDALLKSAVTAVERPSWLK
jgi:superfamily II DNA or RNA helicase